MILRLAAVLARNDPIPFVLNLTNTYSPAIGRTLKALGIGRLVEHARREHDFINIYRSRDAARHLSDAEFARVLAFVEAAFDLALDFAAKGAPEAQGGEVVAAEAPATTKPGRAAPADAERARRRSPPSSRSRPEKNPHARNRKPNGDDRPDIDHGMLTGLVGFHLRHAQIAVFRDFAATIGVIRHHAGALRGPGADRLQSRAEADRTGQSGSTSTVRPSCR